MKRGPDLDIEALLTDLDNDPLSVAPRQSSGVRDTDIESQIDADLDDTDVDEDDEDEYRLDDEYSEN